ncbi:MAG TPA: hypothetical protein VK911_06525 [Vicinamibacterales bacterium]|nr:hypothetical protein [Vicinamibacterales bacterium]
MRRMIVASLLCLSFALVSTTATAQEQVTALLKSGERVSGELVDLGGYDYTFKVNGQERRIAIGDMVLIDFSGNAQNLNLAEAARAGDGRHVIVMRDGQVIEGRLLDIREATKPLALTVEVGGQKREMTSSEVARVYTDRPSAAVATSGSAQGAGNARTVQVSAARQWTPTGITVRQGEVVQFSSSGEVRLSGNPDDVSQVAGKAGDYAVRATIPRTLLGALIGRIGNGEPFGIGDQSSITMPASGQLYLGVNDADFRDNSGEFTVVLTPQSGAAGSRAIPRRR